MSPVIRPETAADIGPIRDVNRLAFGREDEARLVDALRDGGYARVSLVAEGEGWVVGHILFSALTIATPRGHIEALAQAPMAMVPSHQRKGIGSALVGEGLRMCRDAGHRIVLVVGHPEFYPRFRFSAKFVERLKSPFSGPAFMALDLVPAPWRGSREKSGIRRRSVRPELRRGRWT